MSADEAIGRMRGATEALSVLQARPRAHRPSISGHARALLATYVDVAAWNDAGLPTLQPHGEPVPVRAETVVRLARLVTSIHCADLRLADRPVVWSRLESFFARRLPASSPELVRLRGVVCNEQLEADCLPPDVAKLKEILEFQRKEHGEDSYLAGLTRGTLSGAYRQLGDFAPAISLLDGEEQLRASRYGRDHPVTLVARSLLARLLLLQAEAADEAARLVIAQRALDLINEVRAARDRMYGVAARNATLSRRHEGHALLLLGDLDRARVCLDHVLTFEMTRDGRADLYSSGQTHLLLARVYAAQGNWQQAREHAGHAHRISSAHSARGMESAAAALARDIDLTRADG